MSIALSGNSEVQPFICLSPDFTSTHVGFSEGADEDRELYTRSHSGDFQFCSKSRKEISWLTSCDTHTSFDEFRHTGPMNRYRQRPYRRNTHRLLLLASHRTAALYADRLGQRTGLSFSFKAFPEFLLSFKPVKTLFGSGLNLLFRLLQLRLMPGR